MQDFCELCGNVAEIGQIGPNGERVCLDCGVPFFKFTNHVATYKRHPNNGENNDR